MKFIAPIEEALFTQEQATAIDAMLIRVYNRVLEENLLRLPRVILNIIHDQTQWNALRENFLRDNKESLTGNEDAFIASLDKVEEQHVDKPYGDILELALKAMQAGQATPVVPDYERPSNLAQIDLFVGKEEL